MADLIHIRPRRMCLYDTNCTNYAQYGLVWAHESLPNRLVLMPTCDYHLSAALVMYQGEQPKPEQEQPNQE